MFVNQKSDFFVVEFFDFFFDILVELYMNFVWFCPIFCYPDQFYPDLAHGTYTDQGMKWNASNGIRILHDLVRIRNAGFRERIFFC